MTLTHRRVYSLAYRLVGDPHDAEDVAQDAYLRMFQALEGFREKRGSRHGCIGLSRTPR